MTTKRQRVQLAPLTDEQLRAIEASLAKVKDAAAELRRKLDERAPREGLGLEVDHLEAEVSRLEAEAREVPEWARILIKWAKPESAYVLDFGGAEVPANVRRLLELATGCERAELSPPSWRPSYLEAENRRLHRVIDRLRASR